MDSHITIASMENRTNGSGGGWQLPLNGWEEECFVDCNSLFVGEEECRVAQSAEALVKAESNGSDCLAGYSCNSIADLDSVVTDCFDLSTDAFSGELNDFNLPWVGLAEQDDLPGLFESLQPLFGSGVLNIPSGTSLQLRAEEEANSGLFFDSNIGTLLNTIDVDDEEHLISAAEDEQSYELVISPVDSDLRFDLVEESISPCSRDLEVTGAESGIEESFQNNDDDDDEDWERSRKRKRIQKRKRSFSIEPHRKSMKMDPQLRKKEQNKNAATRYREKKRLEELERQATCELLENRNRELRKVIEDKENEVKLLKELLVNVLRPSSRR